MDVGMRIGSFGQRYTGYINSDENKYIYAFVAKREERLHLVAWSLVSGEETQVSWRGRPSGVSWR